MCGTRTKGWTIRRAGLLLAIVPSLTLLGAPGRALAAADNPQEVRLYLDLDGVVFHKESGPISLGIRPWGRSEQRFRTEGLVYLKSFAGLRLGVLHWLLIQLYYAHKDLLYTGKPKSQAHMAVLDTIFRVRLGPLRLLDRNGFECHVTDRFFRYRQYLEARVMLPYKGVRWLGFFAGGELRVDSDEARVNMLDLRAGLVLRASRRFFFKPYYYLEAKRRHATQWHRTHILGLFLAARL